MKHKLLIKETRIRLGLSQAEFAKALGISQSFYCDLENQKYGMGLDLFLDITEVFDVCPSLLVENRKCGTCMLPGRRFFRRMKVIKLSSKCSNT